jgi:hypothetical protein
MTIPAIHGRFRAGRFDTWATGEDGLREKREWRIHSPVYPGHMGERQGGRPAQEEGMANPQPSLSGACGRHDKSWNKKQNTTQPPTLSIGGQAQQQQPHPAAAEDSEEEEEEVAAAAARDTFPC